MAVTSDAPDDVGGTVTAGEGGPKGRFWIRTVSAYGVDGCRGGWFFIELDSAQSLRWGAVGRLHTLVESVQEPGRVFVDMPIGLPDGPEPRACDLLARRRLGKRHSSVFSAPARTVLEAGNYDAARRLSKQATGRSISRQAFGIVPKIREVDELLRGSARARALVREVHPEICFRALANGRPMVFNKKTADGFTERLAVLNAVRPDAESEVAEILRRCRGRGVAPDDVLDAFVAAVTALHPEDALATLPAEPPRDRFGLPMQMVYVKRPTPVG